MFNAFKSGFSKLAYGNNGNSQQQDDQKIVTRTVYDGKDVTTNKTPEDKIAVLDENDIINHYHRVENITPAPKRMTRQLDGTVSETTAQIKNYDNIHGDYDFKMVIDNDNIEDDIFNNDDDFTILNYTNPDVDNYAVGLKLALDNFEMRFKSATELFEGVIDGEVVALNSDDSLVKRSNSDAREAFKMHGNRIKNSTVEEKIPMLSENPYVGDDSGNFPFKCKFEDYQIVLNFMREFGEINARFSREALKVRAKFLCENIKIYSPVNLQIALDALKVHAQFARDNLKVHAQFAIEAIKGNNNLFRESMERVKNQTNNVNVENNVDVNVEGGVEAGKNRPRNK